MFDKEVFSMTKKEKSISEIKQMIDMIAPANIQNKDVNQKFQQICVGSEDKICKKYLKFTAFCNKQIKMFITNSGYGRRDIVRTYDAKKRKDMYKQAIKNASTFSKDIYTCKELTDLLDEITDSLVFYLQQVEKQYNTATPFFIRGIICLTSLQIIDAVRKVSILATGEPRKKINSQSFILTYIHDRSESVHNYEIFKSRKKMLTYKWGIKPTTIYDTSTYYAPEVPFDYAGHKDGILGFIVKEMLEQIDYEKYADVFGGSGRALLQFPLCMDYIEDAEGNRKYKKEYYVNDLHEYNHALYQCMKEPKLYKEFILELSKRQEWYIDLLARLNEFRDFTKDKKLQGHGIRKSIKAVLKSPMLQVFNARLHNEYQKMYDNYDNQKKLPTVERAVEFVLLHQFLLNGRPLDDIPWNTNLFRYLQDGACRWLFERDFKGMHNAYKSENVFLDNKADINFIPTLPNDSNVVLQIDPPYISTAQYSAKQYSLQDMMVLMDMIKATESKRKFIFHCQTKPNKTVSNTVEKKKIFKDFMKYWGTFEEDLWVTFVIDLYSNNLTEKNLNDNEYIIPYLNSLFIGQKADDGSIKKSKDNPEIIITNFPVKINSIYNLQGMFNPYSVLLTSKKVNNEAYKVVTVLMRDYLPEVLKRL